MAKSPTQGGGCTPPSYVPAQYAAGVCSAASALGVPVQVVAAQINMESGYQLNAVSSTGAQGPAQFEPGTWSGEGCSGSPFNWNDAIACYTKYMGSLLKQEKGSVRNALAAYNAGPADLAAGYGYADTILKNAGQPSTITGTGGTGSSTSGTGTAAGNISSVCLIGFSSSGLGGTSWINDIVGTGGNIGQGQLCVLRKSQARALVGGALMLPVLGLALVGTALLAFQTMSRGLGGAGRVAGTTAEIAGAGLALAGMPEVGAPVAAAGGAVKKASKGSQGRAGKYAQRRHAERRAGDQELADRGASDIKTARKPPGTLGKPTKPGRKVAPDQPGPGRTAPKPRPKPATVPAQTDKPPF
jgi:hypothetical protein